MKAPGVQKMCMIHLVNITTDKKAWMTGDIYQDRILALEWQVRAEKRKSVLLIDNCLVHESKSRHIEHIKVMFLPPNCMSIFQPMCARCCS